MIDTLRPHAERMLGKPVQFFVHSLRRFGDMAVASVLAQRPRRDVIAVETSSGAVRGYLHAEHVDGTSLQALYRKSGKT